jgi:hypothetical protein
MVWVDPYPVKVRFPEPGSEMFSSTGVCVSVTTIDPGWPLTGSVQLRARADWPSYDVTDAIGRERVSAPAPGDPSSQRDREARQR